MIFFCILVESASEGRAPIFFDADGNHTTDWEKGIKSRDSRDLDKMLARHPEGFAAKGELWCEKGKVGINYTELVRTK